MALLLPVFLPAIHAARTYARRDAAFPTLIGFDAEWEAAFLRTHDAELARVSRPAGWGGAPGNRVGHLAFRAERRAQLVLNEPHPDWTRYRRLRFAVYSELDRPVTLRLRVLDDRLHSWRDRSDHELRIVPGVNAVAVSLAAIRSRPKDRELDLSAIRRLSLHPVAPEPPFAIHLDELRLE